MSDKCKVCIKPFVSSMTYRTICDECRDRERRRGIGRCDRCGGAIPGLVYTLCISCEAFLSWERKETK